MSGSRRRARTGRVREAEQEGRCRRMLACCGPDRSSRTATPTRITSGVIFFWSCRCHTILNLREVCRVTQITDTPPPAVVVPCRTASSNQSKSESVLPANSLLQLLAYNTVVYVPGTVEWSEFHYKGSFKLRSSPFLHKKYSLLPVVVNEEGHGGVTPH
jgi:hypothetical protein